LSEYFETRNLFRRMLPCCMLLIMGSAGLQASFVYLDINGAFAPGGPGCCYWAAPSGKIGWYWTPTSNLDLVGIETKLVTGFFNINNNFTLTTSIWTDRPANGGALLGSFTWNGTNYIDPPWQGNTFSSA